MDGYFFLLSGCQLRKDYINFSSKNLERNVCLAVAPVDYSIYRSNSPFITPELADEPLHVFFLLCKDCSLYKDECH